jgi:hypothetical protein
LHRRPVEGFQYRYHTRGQSACQFQRFAVLGGGCDRLASSDGYASRGGYTEFDPRPRNLDHFDLNAAANRNGLSDAPAKD